MRHKCFIAYHHDDQTRVDTFIRTFDEKRDVFINRGLGMTSDVIESEDVDYVMRRIRQLYLQDSTVTIVLVGKCTWARRFVDWEVQASLRQPQDGKPNGLVAILLPHLDKAVLPERVKANVESGYAKYYKYPQSADSLSRMIDEAFNARTDRPNVIKNSRERFTNNRHCE